jgi:hypothetical protein
MLLGICNNGDVRLNDEGTPWIYWNNHWSPICGDMFWDNDVGATLFCQKLGYNSGMALGKNSLKNYTVDSFRVGNCIVGDNLENCTGGSNDYSLACAKVSGLRMVISCSGGKGEERTSSCKGRNGITTAPFYCTILLY